MTPISLSLEDLLAQFLAFLPRLISGVVIFLITLYVSAWLAKIAGLAMERRMLDKEVIVLLKRVVRLAVLIIGIIQALAQVNFDVTSLIAGLGIAGFTIGFALQDVAKNFVAGVLLLLQQPFNIGDAIEVAGFGGKVTDITLRTTELRTWDGRDVLIPNGDVYVKPIINFSRNPRRRIDLAVSIKQDWEPGRLTDLVLEALGKESRVLAEPASEAVGTASGEATTELTAFYWVDTDEVGLREAQNAGVNTVREALEAQSDDLGYVIKANLIDAA